MNGKGDTPRPLSVDTQTYHDNWERIFGGKSKEPERIPKEPTPDPEYLNELKSGMFFEWYPGFTGKWDQDKMRWTLIKLTRQAQEQGEYDASK